MKRGLGGLLAAALLLGCVAHEKNGDRAVALGDWKSAYVEYRQALANEPEAPGLKAKFEQARTRALEGTRRRAQTCAQTGDWECALAEADFAQSIDGGDAEIASFRAQAAAQVALMKLERARELARGDQLSGAVDTYQQARALSGAPEVQARAEQVRGDILGAGTARVEQLTRARDYEPALELARKLATLDSGVREWVAYVERERDAFYRAESARLEREGDAARRQGQWDAAAEHYAAALRLTPSGPVVKKAEYARCVAQGEQLARGRDWAGAAAQYRSAVQTGQDDGFAAQRLELVEVRPYRISLRSVLVSPTRNDGQAWAGVTNALFYQMARLVTEAAARGGNLRLVETAAASIPAENRPTLRVEVMLPDGTRLTTPARNGVFVPLDAELVLGANGMDERAVSFRVLVDGAQGGESVGVVEVPVRELVDRKELRLDGGSILALRLASAHAPGRQPGVAVGLSPLQAPGGAGTAQTPPPPPTPARAHEASPPPPPPASSPAPAVAQPAPAQPPPAVAQPAPAQSAPAQPAPPAGVQPAVGGPRAPVVPASGGPRRPGKLERGHPGRETAPGQVKKGEE